MNWKLADGRVYSPPIEDISLHRGVALPDIEKPKRVKKRIAPTRTPVPLAAPPPSRKPVPPRSALETYRSMESGIGRQAYLAEHGQTLLAQERKLRTPLADARPPADNVAAFDAFVSYEAMPAGSEKRAYLMADMRKIHLGSRLKDEQKRTR